MKKIITTILLYACFISAFGQSAVRDTIFIYETVTVYDTLVIRDTVRIKKNSQPTPTFPENCIILNERNNEIRYREKDNVLLNELGNMKLDAKSFFSGVVLSLQTMATDVLAQDTLKGELPIMPIQITIAYPITSMGNQTVNYCYNISFNMFAGRVGSVSGVEYGMIYNHVVGNMKGAQFGGILNVTSEMKGVQFGGIGNVSNEFSGVGFGGIFNRTGTLRGGIQFGGIVNVIDTIESGVSIALINIVKKGGYREWLLTTADYLNAGLSVKMGIPNFYTILTLGANIMEDELWATGVGFGARRALNWRFDFQPEIISYQYRPWGIINDRTATSTHIKIGFVYKLNERFGLVVAPSVYYFNNDITKYDAMKISPIPSFFGFDHNWSYRHYSTGEQIRGIDRHSFGAGISIGVLFN